jgi:ubiquinone/menaquinone biosynthesis C-methylase UbiE
MEERRMDKRRIRIMLVAALLGAALAGWIVRQRSRPTACPYNQRVFLDLPRPFLSRKKLLRMLAPAPGERVLEVGPGTGYYTLAVADRLGPGGQIDALDLQQPMLDEMMARAHARGLSNVVPVQRDARQMPFPDAVFDAAFLVATLGEIPDRDRALRELHRVLKPGGRLVVGEGQPDPHMLTIDDLRSRAEAIGFVFDGYEGTSLGYFARFRSG